MGAWSQLASQLLAFAGRPTLINPNRIPLSSRSRGSLQHLRSLSGLWNRPSQEDSSLPKPATSRWQQPSIFGIVAISAILHLGGTQPIEAEEACCSSAPDTAASTLNKVTDVHLQGQAIQEANTAEVASNVHTAKWRVFTDMGRDLFSKGRLDESEKYLAQALDEAKQGFGEKDAHVASSCNNLAELYRMKRDYGKAELLFLEAIEILERAFNPNHEDSVSFTLHNLGGTYLVQRKFDEASKCYEVTFDPFVIAHGSSAVRCTIDLSTWSASKVISFVAPPRIIVKVLISEIVHLVAADSGPSMRQRSLEIKAKELGRIHPEFANTMFHLGEVLRLQGQFTEAQKLIQESIDILQEGGVEHSQVAIRRMGRLVEIFSQTGQLKEAEKLQRKILHNLELWQGAESSNATTAAENLAGTLQAVGKLEEAEELLQRSFEVRQKILPPTHIQLGVTMFKLASVFIQRGDELVAKKKDEAIADAKMEYERAEELLRRAIRIAERSWKPVSGAQGSVAMRAGPLISLLRSLDALGRLELKKLELATSAKEVEVGKKKAETLFRHCLLVLDKPGISQDVSSIPEFQRQHAACLRHLAMLLSSTSKIDVKITRTAEADQLLKKAEHIEVGLKKHKMKVS